MEQPFFSIVLPAYNRANIIPDTIKSVINQDFKGWELVVVDDGSKDNTKEVLERIDDPRVKYVYQTNKERSAARNNGIRNSIGQYICFLDSDDLFEPNHLSVLYDYIKGADFPKELIFTNCYFYRDEKKELADDPKLEGNIGEYFLKNSVIPARVCIHKEILSEFKFQEDIVIVEDTVLWVSIASKYDVKHIEENTVLYRLHDDNSVNIKNNCFLPRLKGLKKLFENKEITKNLSDKAIKQAISNCYLGISKHYEFKRSFLPMLINIVASIFTDISSAQTKFKLYMIYRYIRNREDV